MGKSTIEYFNRYSGKVENEEIYGEGFVCWTYGSVFGKISLEGLVKRAIFSKWYGRRMNAAKSWKKVLPFIRRYGLNVGEFAEAPESYRTFNEFFYRKLKLGSRLVVADENAAVFPVDGRHLGFQNIE